MPTPPLVERALALVPDLDEFLPLKEAIIGTSAPDQGKRWARSAGYATMGKRLVDPARVEALIGEITERTQRRVSELYRLVTRAIEEEQGGHPAAAAATLIRAGELEEGTRRPREAENIYRLALGIAQNLKDKGPHILALRRLGRVLRATGRLDEAWACYEQSYQLSNDALDVNGQVIACQGLGNLCDDHGQWDQSRAWYERGLQLARELDRPDLVWPFHANLAISCLHSGNLAEAELHLARTQEEIARGGDEAPMMFWYNNKGLVLLELENGAAAEAVYREGLHLATEPLWEMLFRINLGHALVLLDRLFEAEEEARRAEELAILHRFIDNLVDVYNLLGCVARARRDEEGFIFYEQALSVCREQGLPEVQTAYVYWEYGKLQLACGFHDQATAYLERARGIYAALGQAMELGKVERDLASARAALPAAEGV